MNRLVLASVAVVLLSGCGGSPQPSSSATQIAAATQTAPPLTTPSEQTSHVAGASAAAGLVVGQQGSTAAHTLWSLRIEDTSAKPIVEQIFNGGRIAFSRSIPGGNYRVIVWSRPCEGACPATGEAGLGQLQEVCGAQVTLAPGRPTKSTAVLANDGTCTIKIEH
ncbi:hypothetical protein ACWEOO_29425 [Kribbella sp. NPDC004138]